MTVSESSKPSAPIRAAQGPMAAMDRMMPVFSDITFWLFVNVIFLLYIGIFELADGYGPGAGYSAGAIIVAVIYLLLWMYRKTSKKMADQWLMIISGLAVLGDLIVIGWLFAGSFSGGSALLDFAGIMLFRSTYKEYRSPA